MSGVSLFSVEEGEPVEVEVPRGTTHIGRRAFLQVFIIMP